MARLCPCQAVPMNSCCTDKHLPQLGFVRNGKSCKYLQRKINHPVDSKLFNRLSSLRTVPGLHLSFRLYISAPESLTSPSHSHPLSLLLPAPRSPARKLFQTTSAVIKTEELKILPRIEETIGNTPMVYLNRVSARCGARIACKMEAFEPCRSVKDRIALAMVEDAEEKGLIVPGKSTLVEATSGNTGVGLAFICATKGYKLILCMPEDQSIERRILVQAFGAQVILTPKNLAMTGAIKKAENLCAKIPGAHSLQQFKNPSNPRCHFETTGPEIWRDTKGKIDFLIAGVGTGGTITGCGEFLKSQNSLVQIVAVEPSESAVISGGRPGYHQIQGIGAGFVPEVLNIDILDEIIRVPSRDAFEMARRLHQEEGLMVGISSGAAAHAAVQIGMRPENNGKLIVCVLPSFGERYISTPLFAKAWRNNLEEEQRMPLDWTQRKDLDERPDGPGGGAVSGL